MLVFYLSETLHWDSREELRLGITERVIFVHYLTLCFLWQTPEQQSMSAHHVSPDKLQSKWRMSAAPPRLTNMQTHHNTGQQPWDPGMHLLSQAFLGETRHALFKCISAHRIKKSKGCCGIEKLKTVPCIYLPSAIPPKTSSCASISCSRHIPMFPFSMFLISGRSRQSVGARIASMPDSSSLRLTAKLVKLYIWKAN